jgi:hypothetical protein
VTASEASGRAAHRSRSQDRGDRRAGHPSRRRRSRRHRSPARRFLRPVLVAAVVVVGIVAAAGVVGLVHGLRLERRLEALPAGLRAAQADAETGHLAAAIQQLDAAESILAAVNSSLYNSLDFKLLDVVPVARQNVAALRRTVTLGLQMVGGGQQILDAAAPLESSTGHLDVSLKGGQLPVSTVTAVDDAIDAVYPSLPASVSVDHSIFVDGRIRAAETSIERQAVARRTELASVSGALQLIGELAGANGPRRFLVAVANEAEMRGTGGMILSYGVLTSAHGRISLGAFGPIDDLTLSKPAKATFPADFLATYHALDPNELWRNANIMTDFTVVAPVLESMYTDATGLPVNGVIQVDSTGLGAILDGTGPVDVAGVGTITATDVVPVTLNQLYVEYPDRPVRQEYLTSVAHAVFAQLTSGSFPSLRPLGTALVRDGAERHVLIYDNSPTVETTIRALGFSGALPPATSDFAQLAVENFGGDKMDYYLDSTLDLAGILPAGRTGHLTATVQLANTAPAGRGPAYVFGPDTDAGDPPGEYRGLVILYLPAYAYLERSTIDATATDPVEATQNGVTTITYAVAIPPGGRSHVTIDVQLAPRAAGPLRFVLVPTPRVNHTVVNAQLHS